jgi:hypothetical protein
MTETLLTQTSIKIFGRVLNDLQYTYDTNTIVRGDNNFLQSQLAGASGTPVNVTGSTTTTLPTGLTVTAVNTVAGLIPGMTVTAASGGNPVFQPNTVITTIGPGLTFGISAIPSQPVAGAAITATLSNSVGFARIYAFSFEGALYTLPRPSIFLVHGIGFPVDIPATGNNRTSLDQSGVIAREWEFAAAVGRDLRYWEYEKGDFSLRLDPEAGPFEQILLPLVLRSGADRSDRSGAGVSGAGVSGAGVSGAGVSGAGVSGAGVSGAGVRR